MDTTPNLSLPYLFASQAQKHVTHNEALTILDAVIHAYVVSHDETSPPPSPADGERYLLPSGVTDLWQGHENALAAWQDGVWNFHSPSTGWVVWVSGENCLKVFDGSQWVIATGSGQSANTAALFGINTTADIDNKLAVKSPNTLLSHDGSDHRVKINKADSADTASLLFQSNWQGHAELGLTGDDDYHLKVSQDGSTWFNALIVDNSSGEVCLPQTDNENNLLINGDFAINQRSFSGGALNLGDFGYDRWKAISNGCIVSATNGVLSLTHGRLQQTIELPQLAGRTVTFSVEDLNGGSLDISVAGQTATLAPNSGRTGATITVPTTQTGNIIVEVDAISAPITLKNVKLEAGPHHSAWKARPAALELVLCQRYFQQVKYNPYQQIGSARINWDGRVDLPFRYLATMRATPTISISGPSGDVFEVNANGNSYLTSFQATGPNFDFEASVKFTPIAGDQNSVGFIRRNGTGGSTYFEFDAEL